MSLASKGDNMTEIFQKLESNDPKIVKEIQQFIVEQYQEVKESWLVNGLYDVYCQTGSAGCLQLILDVRDPHERHLLDKITDGLKQQDKPRLNGLTVLGYVIRKQPSWLYKITQHAIMKELIKILKTEDDIVIMMNGLLDLLALMPILPIHIATYLQDLFEVFSRVASWRYQCVKGLPEVQKIHLQVGLYAFFHRLYGMFPCNFLSYLRAQYADNNKDNQAVFIHTIRPMLNSVTMHPLLVTHSRELEKSNLRWTKMELHDIIVESSRYSLVSQESSQEDNFNAEFDFDIGSYAASVKSQSTDLHTDPHGLFGSATQDPMWSPGRKFDVSTPPPLGGGPSSMSGMHTAPLTPGGESLLAPSPGGMALSRHLHESPPEAAIEATPETTPFVTPVKDEKFKFARPAPSSQVSRHLRLDVGTYRSPQPVTQHQNGLHTTSGGTGALKSSPTKDKSSFRFPEPSRMCERRDSLFFDRTPTGDFGPKISTSCQTSSTITSSNTLTSVNSSSGSKETSVALSSSVLLSNIHSDEDVQPSQSSIDRRPSPIKFTSQRPKQFPIQPKPERHPAAVTDAVKHKMLSLDNLKDSLPDFGREEDDDEVTEITGGSDTRRNDLSTRHITPQMYSDSAATSRTVSRLSSSSQADDLRKSDCSSSSRPTTSTDVSRLNVIDITSVKVASVTSPAATTDCKSGGLHPPSRDTVNDFVRQIRGRIRYASICGSSNISATTGPSGMPSDIAAEVSSILDSDLDESDEVPSGRRRSSSCPDAHQLVNLGKKKKNVQDDSTDKQLSPSSLHNADGSEVAQNGDIAISRQMVDASVKRFCLDKVCQTEAYLVYPYEHLFPSALPSWFASDQNSQSETEIDPDSKPTHNNSKSKTENPYEILDRFVQAAFFTAQDFSAAAERATKTDVPSTKLLKEEISLLHSEILYERHRRETLGVRNRRLLGKTRSSRILEEQNAALVDQLNIVQSEINQLFTELETLRRQKHELEEERAQHDKQRDKEIESLMFENKTLKQQKLDTESMEQQRKDEINAATSEIAKLNAALFNAKSEIDRLTKKEEARTMAEKELLHLRKEVLLLGELLKKYRDQPDETKENVVLYDDKVVALAKQQVNALQNEVNQRTSEADAYKARVSELENIISGRDQAMTEQKRLLKKVKEEHEENLKVSDDAYVTLIKAQSQLEFRILELQDQLSQANRGNKKGRKLSPTRTARATGGALPSILRGSGASASMNIDLPHYNQMGTAEKVDKTFKVGSPPSSGGSYGSDRSERIRQGFETGIGSRSPPDLADRRSVNGDGRR